MPEFFPVEILELFKRSAPDDEQASAKMACADFVERESIARLAELFRRRRQLAYYYNRPKPGLQWRP